MKAIVVALGVIGGGFALATPVSAQSVLQLKWCNGDDHATPDLSIDGCTALIRSGKYSGRDLAIAYTNRGSPDDDERDEDRAIADHDSAIRIDPKLELAFNKSSQCLWPEWPDRSCDPTRTGAVASMAKRFGPGKRSLGPSAGVDVSTTCSARTRPSRRVREAW